MGIREAAFNMPSVLNREWRGVLALIWLVCGAVFLWLIERFVDPLVREYFSTLWIIGGWLFPAFALAISGIRNGNVASRICGILVLLALAAPIVFILYVGHILANH